MKNGLFVLAASAALTGCLGESDVDSDSSKNVSISKAGIYEGTYLNGTDTGSTLLLVTSDAEVAMVSDDAELALGTVSESGSTLTLTTRYYADGAGSNWGTRLSASLNYNNSTLSGQYTILNETGNLSLTQNTTLYNRSTALADFAGTWKDDDNLSYTINSSGAISAVTDPSTGCTLTGRFELINPSYNEFEVELTTTGCKDTTINGEWEGYGFLSDENGTKSVINFGALNSSGEWFSLGELTKSSPSNNVNLSG